MQLQANTRHSAHQGQPPTKVSLLPEYQPRYERPRQICQHLKISNSTLWHWAKTRPDFPKPIKAGQRVTLFDLNAINAWVDSQKEAK